MNYIHGKKQEYIKGLKIVQSQWGKFFQIKKTTMECHFLPLQLESYISMEN